MVTPLARAHADNPLRGNKSGETREQTWKILERDRNRVWWWTATTFTLWGIALFLVLLMMVLYALVFPLQAKLHQNDQLARIGVMTKVEVVP